ncbi:MAG TPA: methyltransferase [Chitinispirillaceae bacterium]|nr:methyltransferase [Chitinispirillaceae bacterium]
MPVFPGLFEKISLLRNDEPGFLLDMSGTQGFRALCTAHKLGIFECLDPHPLTAKEVASRLNLDPRGTGLLLEALEALGYLEDNGDKYCNSKIVKKWLLKDSPSSFSTALPLYSSLLFEFSELLEYTIREGKPHFTLHEWLSRKDDEVCDSEKLFLSPTQIPVEEILDKTSLQTSAGNLLEISSSRGFYSRELCRRYPGLRAVVLESPLSGPENEIVTDEFSDRISIYHGNYLNSLPELAFDVILIFNVLHRNSDSSNESLIENVKKALNPGGSLIILDQLGDQSTGPATKAFTRLQALNLFNASGGQIYTFSEISSWLEKAGFTDINRKKLSEAPLLGLIFALKPGAEE